MSSIKKTGEKIKLIASRGKNAPRWADIKSFGLKRARSRRVRVSKKHWRHGKIRI